MQTVQALDWWQQSHAYPTPVSALFDAGRAGGGSSMISPAVVAFRKFGLLSGPPFVVDAVEPLVGGRCGSQKTISNTSGGT